MRITITLTFGRVSSFLFSSGLYFTNFKSIKTTIKCVLCLYLRMCKDPCRDAIVKMERTGSSKHFLAYAVDSSNAWREIAWHHGCSLLFFFAWLFQRSRAKYKAKIRKLQQQQAVKILSQKPKRKGLLKKHGERNLSGWCTTTNWGKLPSFFKWQKQAVFVLKRESKFSAGWPKISWKICWACIECGC